MAIRAKPQPRSPDQPRDRVGKRRPGALEGVSEATGNVAAASCRSRFTLDTVWPFQQDCGWKPQPLAEYADGCRRVLQEYWRTARPQGVRRAYSTNWRIELYTDLGCFVELYRCTRPAAVNLPFIETETEVPLWETLPLENG